MNIKSFKVLAMVVVFNVALISCSQNISLDSNQEASSSTPQETPTTATYCCIDTIDGISYEIPNGWQTYYEDSTMYHYYDDVNYLMVSSFTTDFSKDTDRVLTDNCADTLLSTLNEYPSFLLETDCNGDVDGAYCRKIVCSYSDDTSSSVVERFVTFSVNGTVYSFDCVSLNDQSKNYEDFRRIIGSIIVTVQ